MEESRDSGVKLFLDTALWRQWPFLVIWCGCLYHQDLSYSLSFLCSHAPHCIAVMMQLSDVPGEHGCRVRCARLARKLRDRGSSTRVWLV